MADRQRDELLDLASTGTRRRTKPQNGRGEADGRVGAGDGGGGVAGGVGRGGRPVQAGEEDVATGEGEGAAEVTRALVDRRARADAHRKGVDREHDRWRRREHHLNGGEREAEEVGTD